MKKTLAIALMLFYLTISMVSAISVHYCHGNLVDISVNTPAESCCETETSMSASCCDNVNLQIDLNDDQQTSSSKELVQSEKNIILFASVLNNIKQICKNYSAPSTIINDPPGVNSSELYLLSNSFLFYG